MSRWSRIGEEALDLLFPRTCPACGTAADLEADGLCGPCEIALRGNLGQGYCGRCGSTVGPYAAADDRCSWCRRRSLSVAGMVRVGSFDDALRDLLLAFKYAGREDLDAFLGGKLAAALRFTPWFSQIEAITAVPTCWHRHLGGRPYIAPAIARRAAGETKLPDLPLLRRVRGGPSQVGLNYAQRVKNVEGAFQVTAGVRMDRAVICLVDDVSTTGATLGECARVLKRAGAVKVYAAVVCKTSSLPVNPQEPLNELDNPTWQTERSTC